MMKTSFEEVWGRIVKLQGVEFHTKKGFQFTYSVRGEVLRVSRTIYNLPKSQFEKAYKIMPVENLTELSNVVRGSSYIHAILSDPRINF